MKFTTLDIYNFMSVLEVHTTLNDRGLVLVQGSNADSDTFNSNGSGKSTIFAEALCWCIFGESVRGLKGDEVVNNKVKKDTKVCLTILDDEGGTYEIQRHRKHRDHKNNVLLFYNGENITCKSDTETNKKIVEIIQMDFMSFTNSVVFGQGVSKMFANSTDAEQKKILERMLEIDIFKSCQDLSKKYVTQIQNEIQILEHDIELQKNDKILKEQEIKNLQYKEEELSTKLEQRIQEFKDEKTKYQEEYDKIEDNTDLEVDKQVFTGLMDKVRKKLFGFKKYEESKTQLTVEMMSIQNSINTLNKQVDVDEKKLKDIEIGKNIPKICETCGQKLPPKNTSHIKKHLKDSIEINRKEVSDLSSDLKEVNELLEKVTKQLENKDTLEKEEQTLQENLSDINISINSNNAKAENLLKLIDKVKKEIRHNEELVGTTYADIIQEKIVDVQELSAVISNNDIVLQEKVSEKELYEFWVDKFGNQGIKSVLLDSVTPFLNTRVNYYLQSLTDSTIEVKFSTQTPLKGGEMKDKFAVEVTNMNGNDAYKGNSGGEKKRIDIAINMALQDLVQSRSNKSMDLIVYDEVFESLDAIGAEAVINLLQEKSTQYGTILVITHNENLKELFNKTITVCKENAQTEIIEESL